MEFFLTMVPAVADALTACLTLAFGILGLAHIKKNPAAA